MCGISCFLESIDISTTIFNTSGIKRRGPDSFHMLNIIIDSIRINLSAAVLHIRGKSTTIQPIETDKGILLWNGEVFGGLDIPTQISDTTAISMLLEISNPISVLSKIEGPFAFIYLDKQSKTIWFGKDFLGRRSLLWKESKGLYIGSIGDTENHSTSETFFEIPTGGIYSLDLSESLQVKNIQKHIWPVNQSIFKLELDADIVCSNLLSEAVCIRIKDLPLHCGYPTLLFSGGLDSTILAYYCLLHYPALRLVNIAFGPKFDDVPDRISAHHSKSDLVSIFPHCKIELIEVNVSIDELEEYKERIKSIMAPASTVMDFSIAASLWFGARASAISSKILVAGHGADEIFGGYSRHRMSFKSGGWCALELEIQNDIDRLWIRNLGRDDRAISDHGIEPRFPFLDDKFFRWITQCPLRYRMDPCSPPGIGDKAMLRRIASSLGLKHCVYLQKRAIQFGTRISKLQACGGSGTLSI